MTSNLQSLLMKTSMELDLHKGPAVFTAAGKSLFQFFPNSIKTGLEGSGSVVASTLA